ncbi:MAG: hypothetical protein QM765_21040 [Myxococcales bacterium]
MIAPYDSKESAKLHVQRAMQKIEAAQNLLGEACRELSPIVGGIQQWRAVGKLADQAHARWYKVRDLLSRGVDLDDMTKAAEAARSQGPDHVGGP